MSSPLTNTPFQKLPDTKPYQFDAAKREFQLVDANYVRIEDSPKRDGNIELRFGTFSGDLNNPQDATIIQAITIPAKDLKDLKIKGRPDKQEVFDILDTSKASAAGLISIQIGGQGGADQYIVKYPKDTIVQITPGPWVQRPNKSLPESQRNNKNDLLAADVITITGPVVKDSQVLGVNLEANTNLRDLLTDNNPQTNPSFPVIQHVLNFRTNPDDKTNTDHQPKVIFNPLKNQEDFLFGAPHMVILPGDDNNFHCLPITKKQN